MQELHEKQNIDLARHDERIKIIEEFVVEMRKNHLPHIYNSLEGLKLKQAKWGGAIALLVVAVPIVIKLFF